MLTENPHVDEIVPFPRQMFRGVTGPGRFFRWCREVIHGRKPTLALDFQGLLRSALIGRVSGARALYGIADAREGAGWLYDRVAPVPAGVAHAVNRYLMLAETVLRREGADGLDVGKMARRFPLPEGEAPSGAVHLLQEPFVVLHPFARGTGKSLTVTQIEAFCRQLAPRRVVLVGRRGEVRFDVPGAAVDLLDCTNLPELIWVMRRASCVVSVDSGPSHLAAALGKPLVAMHTWSDPRRVGPYRDDAWVWKNGRLLPMGQMRTLEEAFFEQAPAILSAADVEAISALAISLSGSSS